MAYQCRATGAPPPSAARQAPNSRPPSRPRTGPCPQPVRPPNEAWHDSSSGSSSTDPASAPTAKRQRRPHPGWANAENAHWPPFRSRLLILAKTARGRELDGRTSALGRGEGTEFDSLRSHIAAMTLGPSTGARRPHSSSTAAPASMYEARPNRSACQPWRAAWSPWKPHSRSRPTLKAWPRDPAELHPAPG